MCRVDFICLDFKVGDVNDDFREAFAVDDDLVVIAQADGRDRVEVDRACDDLAEVVVGMVASELCTSCG